MPYGVEVEKPDNLVVAHGVGVAALVSAPEVVIVVRFWHANMTANEILSTFLCLFFCSLLLSLSPSLPCPFSDFSSYTHTRMEDPALHLTFCRLRPHAPIEGPGHRITLTAVVIVVLLSMTFHKVHFADSSYYGFFFSHTAKGAVFSWKLNV